MSKSNYFHVKTKFYYVKVGFYVETKQTLSENNNKPNKVAKTIIKYKFNQINKVSGDYWGDPPMGRPSPQRLPRVGPRPT